MSEAKNFLGWREQYTYPIQNIGNKEYQLWKSSNPSAYKYECME